MLHPLPPLALERLGVSPHSISPLYCLRVFMGLVTLVLKSAQQLWIIATTSPSSAE